MNHIEIVRANHARRAAIQGELRAIDEAATADNRDYTDDERAIITDRRSELEAIDNRIAANLDMEIRSQQIDNGITSLLGSMLERQDGEMVDTRSLGRQFVDMDEVRSWVDQGARGASPALHAALDLRAVTDVTTGDLGGCADSERPPRSDRKRLPRPAHVPHRPPADDQRVDRRGRGGARPVAARRPGEQGGGGRRGRREAAGRPTLAVITEPVQTIAAWANITRQAAADAPQVMGYLDGRLRYSVKRRADGQVINGNGTSPNISGLLDRSGINAYTAPSGSEATYRSIRKAITLMEQDEAVPEIVVLNPADAELFDLSNDTSAGLHAVPDLNGRGTRTAWGLTQVRSTAVASGTAILIDPMAVAVLDRQQVTAYMTDSHASNFTSNILTLLLEARLGLAVFDPAGVCSVTFDYVP